MARPGSGATTLAQVPQQKKDIVIELLMESSAVQWLLGCEHQGDNAARILEFLGPRNCFGYLTHA